MNFTKLIKYGFATILLFSNSIATEKDHNNELKKKVTTLICPTISEIHDLAKKPKGSINYATLFSSEPLVLTTKEGVDLETWIDPWDTNKNFHRRALRLTKYDETCCIEKEGLLTRILFRYSPNSGTGIALTVNLAKKDIRAEDFYPTDVDPDSVSFSSDGTKYKTFNDQNLTFTIHP